MLPGMDSHFDCHCNGIYCEILNTAIDRLCGFVQPEHIRQKKEIKVLAAGAVLTSAALAMTTEIIRLLA